MKTKPHIFSYPFVVDMASIEERLQNGLTLQADVWHQMMHLTEFSIIFLLCSLCICSFQKPGKTWKCYMFNELLITVTIGKILENKGGDREDILGIRRPALEQISTFPSSWKASNITNKQEVYSVPKCWGKSFLSRWETIYGIFCVTMSDPRNFLGKKYKMMI